MFGENRPRKLTKGLWRKFFGRNEQMLQQNELKKVRCWMNGWAGFRQIENLPKWFDSFGKQTMQNSLI